MSRNIEIAHRRLLPLTVAAFLLSAAAAQLPGGAGGSPEAAGAQDRGVRVAGVSLSLGFHGHYGHGYYGHRHYRPFYYYRPYYHYRPYPYAYHHYYDYPRYPSRFYGRLDLEVRPKKTTQVYIDGNYVGVAASFDGWPEHLWLEKDSYELIFYNPGYETVVRHVEVRPGALIRIREDMRPGESIPPEELTSAREPEAPRYGPGSRGYAQREPAYERRAPLPPAAPREPAPPAGSGVTDVRPEPARVKLVVAPADATVYLDGRFLGVAGELGEQRSGILIDPGEHVIEVVRPGYRGQELKFEAAPGGEVELEVDLDAKTTKAGYSA